MQSKMFYSLKLHPVLRLNVWRICSHEVETPELTQKAFLRWKRSVRYMTLRCCEEALWIKVNGMNAIVAYNDTSSYYILSYTCFSGLCWQTLVKSASQLWKQWLQILKLDRGKFGYQLGKGKWKQIHQINAKYAQLHFSNHHELPELSPPVPARSLFDSTAPHFPPALPMKSAPLAAKAVALTRRDQQNRYLGWWTAWQHLRVGFQSPPCLLTHSPTKTTMHLNPNPRAASVQSFQHDRLLELIKCRPHWSDIHSSLGGSASHDTSDPRRPASPSSWV